MRTRSISGPPRLALGGRLASAIAVGGLLVGGVLGTTATLVVTDPSAPAAQADSLRRFDSCAALRDWYVGHAVDEVGPYGWGSAVVPFRGEFASEGSIRNPSAAGAVPQPASGSSAATAGSGTEEARANSATGTNTQEAGVDEPDIAKTDGRRVVRFSEPGTLVVEDVTGRAPRELGRISLPVGTDGGELLLARDHVLVISAAGAWRGPVPNEAAGGVPDASGQRMIGARGGTRVVDIDLTDPSYPRIVHDDTYSGTEVSARLYGDTVRLVTSTGRPDLPWVVPGPVGSGRLTAAEAIGRNQDLVRATTLQDWLPTVVDNTAVESTGAPRGGTASRRSLVDCRDVYHPADWSGAGTTTVTTYDVHDPGARTSVAVTADGQVVYSSVDRLYVTSTRVDPPRPWQTEAWRMGGTRMAGEGMAVDGTTAGAMVPVRPQPARTELHAFALEGTSTRYVGSGHVDGTVRDRWSLDEHAGQLRVAWTQPGTRVIRDPNGEVRQATRNGLTILSERAGALVPTGTLTDLGIDENIQSVRWFDDVAVLVTFRQMDPLYTIDLTDPSRPRAIGQLKIPGYSGYLHPIGDHLLLGLGVDATDLGRNLGAQAAVFDLRDLVDPVRLAQQKFGPQSSLPALDDPRGFTWLPDRRTGLTTVASWTEGRARLVALRVGHAGTLEAHDLATDVGWVSRTLPLADGRVALVDDRGVRLLDVG